MVDPKVTLKYIPKTTGSYKIKRVVPSSPRKPRSMPNKSRKP